VKILILSFYYAPDLCPGSFRCTSLVEQLLPLVNEKYEIEVMTTVPNRYATYVVPAPEFEKNGALTIHRIPLPSHQSGMLDQAKAFGYFAKKVNQLVKNNQYALVFATSSRLMTAALGAYIAHQKRAMLYLDIRDIFLDTLQDVLPKKVSFVAKPVFSIIEKWAFRKANHINIVSDGFKDYFKTRYPNASLTGFTNGIDDDFLMFDSDSSRKEVILPLTVLYAGNIGEGQGLHRILPSLAKRMEGRVNFRVIGDGGRKNQLALELSRLGCTNVELLPPIGRQQLLEEYRTADVLFLHLNDYNAFKKVLPSKLFEYGAVGKPIWAGLGGYAADFVEKEMTNAVVFHPCDVISAERRFAALKIEVNRRTDFIQKYKRQHIMECMAKEMMSECLYTHSN